MNEAGNPWIRYCADAVALCVYPGAAIAIAATVSDEDTAIYPEYCPEFVVGTLPFNV